MYLVLIRHGESEWNRLNLFTGWRDIDLSGRGRREAIESGRLLHDEGYDFDICHTSVLKRAIHTLNHVLEEMDRDWLPVIKSWRLNERHYGALEGLNKAETAARYGEEQVRLWRRSYAVRPPAVDEDDARNPRLLSAYRRENPVDLPLVESLADTVARVVPYYREVILKDIAAGARVLISSHGNAIRALVKYLDGISDDAIASVDIPTGVPLVYTLDDDLAVRGKRYLGNQDEINKRAARAAGIAVV